MSAQLTVSPNGSFTPHAVLVHGEPLWQSQQGRRHETAVLQIRLQRVALRLVDEDARQVRSQVVGKGEPVLLVDFVV